MTPESIAELRRVFPDACQQIRDEADGLLAGRFDLLGYRNLWFGDPHRLASRSGMVAARAARSLERDRSARSGGGRRQQSCVGAESASVGRPSGAGVRDDRRRPLCHGGIDAIDHWIEANPVGIGVNWASSLEVAFRLMSWSWVLRCCATRRRCRQGSPAGCTRRSTRTPHTSGNTCRSTSRPTRTSRARRSGCSTPARYFRISVMPPAGAPPARAS